LRVIEQHRGAKNAAEGIARLAEPRQHRLRGVDVVRANATKNIPHLVELERVSIFGHGQARRFWQRLTRDDPSYQSVKARLEDPMRRAGVDGCLASDEARQRPSLRGFDDRGHRRIIAKVGIAGYQRVDISMRGACHLPESKHA